jgi:hypothetical protein
LRPPFVFYSTRRHDEEETMNYMLLIHQGDTPTPRDPEAWGRLSEDEQQAVFAAYGAILASTARLRAVVTSQALLFLGLGRFE